MLICMASASDRDFSTADLADEFGLSRNTLSKFMQRLARADLIEMRRGGGGGAIGAQRLVERLSPGTGDCTIDGRCRFEAHMRTAELVFLADLGRAPLADIGFDPIPTG